MQLDQFARIYGCMAECVAVFDVERRLVYTNQAFASHFDSPVQDLIGTPVWELLAESRGDGRLALWLDEAFEGCAQVHPVPFVVFPESDRWFETILIPSLNSQGPTEWVLLILRDVTDRVHRLDRLESAEKRFNKLMDQIGEAVLLTEASGEIVLANARAVEMLGFPERQLQVMSRSDLEVPGVDKCRFPKSKDEDGEKRYTELLRRNGERILVEVSEQELTVNDRHYVQLVLRDLRKEFETQQRLRENTARFNAIEEQAPFFIMTFDQEGRIASWNRAAARLFGYSQEEAVGKGLSGILFQNTRQFSPESLSATVFQGKTVEIRDAECIAKSGKRLHVLSVCFPLRDADGKIGAGAIAGYDISAHKILQNRLVQTQKMETIGTLAGGIAHDFNNQLTAVIGNLSLVMDELGADHPKSKELADALSGARRCAELTQNLLTFSRKIPYKREPVDLGDLTEEVARLIIRALPPSIEVDFEIEKGDLAVLGDASHLRQVLLNLLVNARDSMMKEGVIKLRAGRIERHGLPTSRVEENSGRGSLVYLEVSDSGSGMSPEVMERVFDPFFTTKDVGKGTGLGLSVVYGVVESHDGWVEVQSREGEGSRFMLYFPALNQPGKEPEGAPESEPGRGELILLVDDEREIREIGKHILEDRGYRVLTAQDGVEAISTYEMHRAEIDLVILDLVMPNLDGRSVMEEIMNDNPSVKVLLSSGFGAVGRFDPANTNNSAPFLQKPYTPQELAGRVRDLIDHCGDRS